MSKTRRWPVNGPSNNHQLKLSIWDRRKISLTHQLDRNGYPRLLDGFQHGWVFFIPTFQYDHNHANGSSMVRQRTVDQPLIQSLCMSQICWFASDRSPWLLDGIQHTYISARWWKCQHVRLSQSCVNGMSNNCQSCCDQNVCWNSGEKIHLTFLENIFCAHYIPPFQY